MNETKRNEKKSRSSSSFAVVVVVVLAIIEPKNELDNEMKIGV